MSGRRESDPADRQRARHPCDPGAKHRDAHIGLSSIYQINVTAGGTDFYIPYRHGNALYCDVPRGRNNGTLVVTFPMNGCALDIAVSSDAWQIKHGVPYKVGSFPD